MRAFARVAAEADGRGGTRLSVLRGEPPLLLRRTGARDGTSATRTEAPDGTSATRTGEPDGTSATRTEAPGAGVTVHLVGGAAGPLRGDDLRLEVSVGPGAILTVRSVAAQLALPGRAGLPPSRLEIRATVAAGGTLRWLPEPLIAAAGCDHHTLTHVAVADGASLLWRDDLVCGRHAEESGNVRTTTTIRYAGRTLYRHDLSVGPGAPGWDGPAVLGGGRAVGMLVIAPAGSLPAGPAPGPDAAVMPLAGPGVLATAVGTDIRQVRAALDPLCAGLTALPAPVASAAANT